VNEELANMPREERLRLRFKAYVRLYLSFEMHVLDLCPLFGVDGEYAL
jgi:hypothetical protein